MKLKDLWGVTSDSFIYICKTEPWDNEGRKMVTDRVEFTGQKDLMDKEVENIRGLSYPNQHYVLEVFLKEGV